jgi:hypothetical protein
MKLVKPIQTKLCIYWFYVFSLRLSDGKSFIDSPLSGPYSLKNG